MFNLLSRPIEPETLDAWAKYLEDVSKIALVALPMVLYGQYSLEFKLINLLLLSYFSYCGLLGGKLIRKYKTFFMGGN